MASSRRPSPSRGGLDATRSASSSLSCFNERPLRLPGYAEETRAAIARALAVPETRDHSREIVDLYRQTDPRQDELYKPRPVSSTWRHVEGYLRSPFGLVFDPPLGSSRVLLRRALTRLRSAGPDRSSSAASRLFGPPTRHCTLAGPSRPCAADPSSNGVLVIGDDGCNAHLRSSRSGTNSLSTMSRIMSGFTRKYSCTTTLRRPAIEAHGVAACSYLKSSGSDFTASPTTARLRSMAS